jgi:hypothetical protein
MKLWIDWIFKKSSRKVTVICTIKYYFLSKFNTHTCVQTSNVTGEKTLHEQLN